MGSGLEWEVTAVCSLGATSGELSLGAEVGRASSVSYQKAPFPVQESPSWATSVLCCICVATGVSLAVLYLLCSFLGVVITDPNHRFGCL